ncbi:MAG TPA: hypothetical protein VJH20_02525 [Candidatus Nanoarchaeia archaeon]|nr:hypothetical protein [Candidatus Nanoarchaeia archaeon]
MVDDNYSTLSRSMYELLNYLRSTPEGGLYDEAGNKRPGTGVVCLTPGGKYFPIDSSQAESLSSAFIGSGNYFVEFAMKPGNGPVLTIHMEGSLKDVLENGKFNLEIILRHSISRKVEASATWSPLRLNNMQNTIKIVDTFLDCEIRRSK